MGLGIEVIDDQELADVLDEDIEEEDEEQDEDLEKEPRKRQKLTTKISQKSLMMMIKVIENSNFISNL